jgi:predicted dehydrogenase
MPYGDYREGNMNTLLNIGLIGCGRAAERFYLPALSRLKEEVRLVAAADPIRGRREIVSASISDCVTFSSAEELLRKARIVAAIITTPPATHVPIAILALRAGINVLVEKPLAPFLTGVEELENLVASSSNSLMIGFNQRYWEPVRQLHHIMNNQECSDEVSAQLIMTSNIQAWSPISRVSDPLDDLGSHQLDLLRFILNREILAVSAHWTDTYVIQMRVTLEDGVVADCLAAQSDVTQESISIQCEGQQYRVHLGSERIQPATGLIRYMLDLSDTLRRRLRGRRSSLRSSFERQLVSFFNYVRTGATPHPGIADGIAVIRATEAARQSAANGGMEVFI